MKGFIENNFLLENRTAEKLYHDYAAPMPIIDYHCHLPPDQIANDVKFDNLTKVWLNGDHYKWRAMRTNGIEESYITGDKPDIEKFEKWAETVPYTLRNPLYHWTHLELKRYFGIDKILNPQSAKDIYLECNALLQQPKFSVRHLMEKMNVKIVCTTDDPLDNLQYHKSIGQSGFTISVFPAFRPDKAMNVNDVNAFNEYLNRLEGVANISITELDSFLIALKTRHDYFETMNCSVSDHGLEEIYADEYNEKEIEIIFIKVRNGKELLDNEIRKFKSFMLYTFAVWDHEKGWVQQYHLGALRNTNKRMLHKLGPDTGWDSIGDFEQGKQLAKFLGRLDLEDKLTKTIIYNLNPADNEIMASMIGNFNDGSIAGKIQYGSAWWFLDQKDGMIKQINALSNMGLLSRFVGMLTDSRSFLSYPRHEYFRRILCNLFGTEIENGELPNDVSWTGKIIQDICYNNARDYFNWNVNKAKSKVE
ncbi:MAG: glucuronate isomerase [Ginsengibacter sp.]